MLPSYQPRVEKSFSSSVCVNIPYIKDQPNREHVTYIYTKANTHPFQLDWQFKWKFDTNGLGLYIYGYYSEKPLNITSYVSVEESSIEKCFTHIIMPSNGGYNYIGHLFNIEELPQCDITLRCHATFQIVEPNATTGSLSLGIGDYFGEFQNKNTDAEIHVDDKVIQIHRGYFSMISPVFYAMFNHDTDEKRTGIVKIKDMNFTTVQNAVNFCYGQPLKNASTSDVLNVQTFGDKYDIKIITKKVGDCISKAVNPFNFCTILNYAWASSNDALKASCAKYYFENVGTIALTPEFCELEKEVLRSLIKSCRAFKK